MNAAAKQAGIDVAAVARKAAASRWAALRVSTDELQALAGFAITALAAVNDVAALAEEAEVADFPIAGGDVLGVLGRHGLYSPDLYHHNITERRNGEERAESENEGLDPAGPADPGGSV